MTPPRPGADTIVVDLDGTLADVEHRRHLIRGGSRNYERFHELCIEDPPNPWCVQLIENFLRAGFKIAIVSGRPASVLPQTLHWLGHALSSLEHVTVDLLREAGDHTPDTELKRRWLERQDRGRILFAVDDRRRVVDMWREEGIVCLQCDDWEEREAAERAALSPAVQASKRIDRAEKGRLTRR